MQNSHDRHMQLIGRKNRETDPKIHKKPWFFKNKEPRQNATASAGDYMLANDILIRVFHLFHRRIHRIGIAEGGNHLSKRLYHVGLIKTL